MLLLPGSTGAAGRCSTLSLIIMKKCKQKPLFHLCIPGRLQQRSVLTTGICLQCCWSRLLLAGQSRAKTWLWGQQSPPCPPAWEQGVCGISGRCIPGSQGPCGCWWPHSSGQTGIHPCCPAAKCAAAALAPCSQLFPPQAPDVSHYPNCNQPGSACFPDWGWLGSVWGCSSPAREGGGLAAAHNLRLRR